MSATPMSREEYRGLPYPSYSSIKSLVKGPKEYFDYLANPFTGNLSTDFGTAIHHLLQGNKGMIGYPPEGVDRRKKEEYAKFEAEFKAQTGDEGIILTKASYEKYLKIEKNLADYPLITEELKKYTFEVPHVFEIDGWKLKGTPDGISDRAVLEIKTAFTGVDADSVRSTIAKKHYDLQAYMYLTATGLKDHYFIFVSTSEPYALEIYKTSQEIIDDGARKFKRVKDNYFKYVVNKEPFNDKIKEL